MEGLACGRPALVSEGCGIADIIRSRSAGAVAARTVAHLSEALDTLQADYRRMALNARAAAEDLFDADRTRQRYASLYARLAPRRN